MNIGEEILMSILEGKEPHEVWLEGGKRCWLWYRMLENPPCYAYMLPAEIFDYMREEAGITKENEKGEPIYALGYDTKQEAIEAAKLAVEKMMN